MKLKVFVKEPEPVKKDKEIFLKLIEHDECVSVVVCDDRGNRLERGGDVLGICQAGVVLYPGVSYAVGFDLDDEGRLIMGRSNSAKNKA